MENKHEILTFINIISTVIFSLMSFFGLMYIIYMITRQENNNLMPKDFAYTAIFIVGSFGLIIQLMFYNIKSLKR